MRKWLLIAPIAVVFINAALSWFLTALTNFPSAVHPSYSIAESKSRSAFVEQLYASPSSFPWNDTTIQFKEVWLEHRTKLRAIIVLIPFLWQHEIFEVIDGYNLCVNFEEGLEPPFVSTFLLVPGEGHGLAQRGTVIFWTTLDRLIQAPSELMLAEDWKFEKSQKVSLKPNR